MSKIKILQFKDVVPKTLESMWSQTKIISADVARKTALILKDKDYSYLLEKSIEDFLPDELKFIEEIFTKHDYIITEELNILKEKLENKFWIDLMDMIYKRLIEIELINLKQSNNTIWWKFKTCNWYWIPFWIFWEEYGVLTKIQYINKKNEKDLKNQNFWYEEICWINIPILDFEKDWQYIHWKYLNNKWIRNNFWYDINIWKYITLKEIDWDDNIIILYPKLNNIWRIIYWKYKNSKGYIIPFWYSLKTNQYIPLKIKWEIICDTFKRKRKDWKLISWLFLNDKWKTLPFWLERDKYVTLKIKWEEIHNVRNRKSDDDWKLISWEFNNWKWWYKFELKWWVYIKKIHLFKKIFSRKN